MIDNKDRIVRLKTVLDRTGLSRSTVYRKIGEGTFPRQIPISINGSGRRESEINWWVANPPAQLKMVSGSDAAQKATSSNDVTGNHRANNLKEFSWVLIDVGLQT